METWGGGDKCVHYFDYGDGFIGEYLCQNLPNCTLYFFFNFKFIYLFLFLAALGLRCGARASHCGVFSCWRSTGSRHAGFSSCGSRTVEHRLSSCGTRA